jgi:DNA (cytosine-5)-methyltransferase 1
MERSRDLPVTSGATPPRLTVLSAFSGLGGLDLGLEAAGFEHVGCIEVDDTAQRSIKANRSIWKLLEPGDIATVAASLKPAELGLDQGELTLLAGGPPCQPFSKAAQWSKTARNGMNDDRSHCLRDFLTLIETLLPHAVLIENVRGFVSGEVSALPEIRDRLYAINKACGTSYEIHHEVVDAADLGVPQHRPRAIIVAFRNGAPFSSPARNRVSAPVRAWDAIGHLDPGPDAPNAVGKWAELLPSIPEGQNYLWHTRRGGGRPLFGYRTRYWSFLLKLAKNHPSWTIPAQPGPSTGPFHWDNRPLTIQEMLCLQSFPADWKVEGDYRQQVRQVGNATPPLHAEIIGRALCEQLAGIQYNEQPLRYQIPRKPNLPPPEPVLEVPTCFLSLEGKHPDHPGPGLGPQPRSTANDSTTRPSQANAGARQTAMPL